MLRIVLVAHLERTGRSGGDFIFGKTASTPMSAWIARKQARDAWDGENERRRGFGRGRCESKTSA